MTILVWGMSFLYRRRALKTPKNQGLEQEIENVKKYYKKMERDRSVRCGISNADDIHKQPRGALPIQENERTIRYPQNLNLEKSVPQHHRGTSPKSIDQGDTL